MLRSFTESEAIWQGAVNAVDHHWGARYLNSEQRTSLAGVTVREFDAYMKPGQSEFTKSDRREIIKRVKDSNVIKTFGLSFIITAILGWVINAILDYLWEKWKGQ